MKLNILKKIFMIVLVSFLLTLSLCYELGGLKGSFLASGSDDETVRLLGCFKSGTALKLLMDYGLGEIGDPLIPNWMAFKQQAEED